MSSWNDDDPLPPDAVAEAMYIYKDANGDLHSKMDRFVGVNRSKTFRAWHWETHDLPEGRWEKGKAEGDPIPYRLDELMAAPPDTDLYICEGEKDVNTLKERGFLATTNANGAKHWTDKHSQWVKGPRRAFVVEDNDDDGRKRSQKIARMIYGLVEEVRIIRFWDAPEHEDVTWWLTIGGHTTEDFVARANNAEIFHPPVIVAQAGDLSAIVDQAEVALLEADIGIYQRANTLVRAVVTDRPIGQDDIIRREPGSKILLPVSETWLREQMGRSARWVRKKLVKKRGEAEKKEVEIVIDPPTEYSRHLAARKAEWKFPVLRSIMSAPTLELGGRIIQRPGYDPASGLLLDYGDGEFPEIPERPSKTDAQAALSLFAELPGQKRAGLLRGFPFADEASKSVALSAMLSGLVRPNLRTVPLHAFDAPAAGTGKSMLAEMVGMLMTGNRPPAMSQGPDATEDEKRLSAVLLSGDQLIWIDNCTRDIEGYFMCTMMTQTKVKPRILGKTEAKELPSTALVVATGNNLTFRGDMTRRVVICRLDAKVERPDQRPFDWSATGELMAQRPALVAAGITAMRAYALADDKPKLSPVGSFEEWDLVRGTLVWSGYADPADTRVDVLRDDPEKAQRAEIMELWSTVFGDRPVTVSDIGKLDHQHKLKAAFVSAVPSRTGLWSPDRVGWWLRHNMDTVVGGRAFRKAGDGWKLEGGGTM